MFGNENTGDSFPFLLPHDIHLWCVEYRDDSALIAACKSALTKLELERSEYYKFEKARSNYILSQGILKLLLGKYLNAKASEVELGRHRKGKPFAVADKSLFFNISNSGNRCVYAFTRTGEVGIDIEELRDLPDLEDMIQRNYSDSERDYINRVPEFRMKKFFQLWTIKEAYVKAIGEGMRLTPENIEVSIENKAIRLQAVRGFYDDTDWQFTSLPQDEAYVGTLVYEGEEVNLSPMRFI